MSTNQKEGIIYFSISLFLILVLCFVFKGKKKPSLSTTDSKPKLELVQIKSDSLKMLIKKFDPSSNINISGSIIKININQIPTIGQYNFDIVNSMDDLLSKDSSKAIYFSRSKDQAKLVLNTTIKNNDTLVDVPTDLLFPILENAIAP